MEQTYTATTHIPSEDQRTPVKWDIVPHTKEELIAEYPWLEEIYQEIAMLRQSPEEVLSMFSEALRILDQNTVKYILLFRKKTRKSLP